MKDCTVGKVCGGGKCSKFVFHDYLFMICGVLQITIIMLLSLMHKIDTFNLQLLHARKKLNGQ